MGDDYGVLLPMSDTASESDVERVATLSGMGVVANPVGGEYEVVMSCKGHDPTEPGSSYNVFLGPNGPGLNNNCPRTVAHGDRLGGTAWHTPCAL